MLVRAGEGILRLPGTGAYMSLDQPLPDVKPLSHSLDGFLDGRLTVEQPKKGFRAGLDSVLLGASLMGASGRLLDLGAGAGAAGLVALANNPGLEAVFAENDPALLELSNRNIERNGFAGRARTALADAVSGEGIERGGFDFVIANPPFYDPARHTVSPSAPAAHSQKDELIGEWARIAAQALKPGGSALFVHHAQSLDTLRDAFSRHFGTVIVQPLAPYPGARPIRVLLRGSEGEEGVVELPAISVHALKGGPFAPQVEAALRGRAGLHWNAPQSAPR